MAPNKNIPLSTTSFVSVFPALQSRYQTLLDILNKWRSAQCTHPEKKTRIVYHSTDFREDKLALVIPCLLASAGLNVPVSVYPAAEQERNFIGLFARFSGMDLHLSADAFSRHIHQHGTAISFPPTSMDLIFEWEGGKEKDTHGAILDALKLFLLLGCPEIAIFDVKTGQKNRKKTDGKELSFIQALQSFCDSFGILSSFLMSDFSQPLGRAVGGILEVKEALDILQGKGPADLFKLGLELGAEGLRLAFPCSHRTEIKESLKKIILSGQPLDLLMKTVRNQGGETDILDKMDTLIDKMEKIPIPSLNSGYLHKLSWPKIRIVQRRLSDCSPDAGILIFKKNGESVRKGDLLGIVYLPPAVKHSGLPKLLHDSFVIGQSPLPFQPFLRRVP